MTIKASEPRSISTQSRLLAERLRQSLLDGAFASGSRLNEVHLARTLSVSRARRCARHCRRLPAKGCCITRQIVASPSLNSH